MADWRRMEEGHESSSLRAALARSVEASFRTRFRAASPFDEDAALVDDLIEHLAPVLAALTPGSEHASVPREGAALLHLFAHRLGLLGATPAVAAGLGGAVCACLAELGSEPGGDFGRQLDIVVFEGYCAGRDERRERCLRDQAAFALPCLELAPRCFCLSLGGHHLLEDLQQALDDRARVLFRAEARGALVDLTRFQCADEDSCRAIVDFLATLRSFGCEPFYRAEAPLAERLESLGVQRHGARAMDTAADAFSAALQSAGLVLRPLRRWNLTGWTGRTER